MNVKTKLFIKFLEDLDILDIFTELVEAYRHKSLEDYLSVGSPDDYIELAFDWEDNNDLVEDLLGMPWDEVHGEWCYILDSNASNLVGGVRY